MITDKVMLKNYYWRMSLTPEQRELIDLHTDQEVNRRWEASIRHEQMILAHEQRMLAIKAFARKP